MNTQKMGSLILDEILTRHINYVYDIYFLKINSQALSADEEHSILKNIEKKNEDM